MNVYHELVFAYLEEDNVQRAYFRARPLLSPSGDIQEEARKTWPDDGALRIVPDRAEQYHFKDRMREIGHYCLVDLTVFAEDSNKIRTNKNYNPAREERNQYILYSDAIKTLPEGVFYQVIPGAPEDYAALSEQAVTPLYFIRRDETLYGPVKKDADAAPGTAAPMEGTLYSLTCPDGSVRDIFCAAPAAQAAPVAPSAPEAKPAPAPIQEETLEIGKPLQILDTAKAFDEQLTEIAQPLSKDANLLSSTPAPQAPRPVPAPGVAMPLSGTPLRRAAGLRTATPRPKNPVQEVVAAQWRAARNDPPAASLASGADLHHVDNPVEDACRTLSRAWQLPEAHQQLADHILSLSGMGQHLTRIGGAADDSSPLQKVLSARLQDLEAERLAALFELDKAKADVETFRKTCIEQAAQAQKALLAEQDELLHQRQSTADALLAQLKALTAQRDALQGEIDHLQGDVLPEELQKALEQAQLLAPVTGLPLRLQAAAGQLTAPEELLHRTMDAFAACGASLAQPDAVTFLLLLALCPRFSIATAAMAGMTTLVRGWMRCCGWESGLAVQETLNQRPVVSALPESPTPLLLLTALMMPALPAPVHTVLLSKTAALQAHTAAWEMAPWPLWQVSGLTVTTLPEPTDAAPVSEASLHALLKQSAEGDDELDKCLAPLVEALSPLGLLTGPMLATLKTFIRSAAPLMEGGLAVAVDRGLALYLPGLAALNPRVTALTAELLAEYPFTASLMRR